MLSGAQACIEVLMNTLKYSNCLLPIPSYSSYHESLREGSKIHYLNLKERENFEINEKDLSKSIEENEIDLLILINPNNPSGVKVSSALIERILKKHKNLQIILVYHH